MKINNETNTIEMMQEILSINLAYILTEYPYKQYNKSDYKNVLLEEVLDVPLEGLFKGSMREWLELGVATTQLARDNHDASITFKKNELAGEVDKEFTNKCLQPFAKMSLHQIIIDGMSTAYYYNSTEGEVPSAKIQM